MMQSYLLRLRIQELSEGKILVGASFAFSPIEEVVEVISGYDLMDLMESSYRRVGTEDTLLVTRSNKDAEGYNRTIRQLSLYYDDEVVAGEQVMVKVRNNYLHRPVDENGTPLSSFIANGELLKVLDTRGATQLHGFNFREAELEDASGGFISAKILMDSLYSGVASLTPGGVNIFDSVALDYPEEST